MRRALNYATKLNNELRPNDGMVSVEGMIHHTLSSLSNLTFLPNTWDYRGHINRA
jgi:hypothetical protein